MKLLFSEKTIEYERKDEYLNAMKQTYKEWKENDTDENLCKALLEFFFIRFKTNMLSTKECPEWDEITASAYERMEHNRELSFFVGYAMFIGFYLFAGDHWGTSADSVRYIEDHGKELMETAYEAEPQCTLYKLHHCIYWGESDYKPTEQEANEIREQFPIPSVICEYFRRILCSYSEKEENLPRFEHYYSRLACEGREIGVCTLSVEEIIAMYSDNG